MRYLLHFSKKCMDKKRVLDSFINFFSFSFSLFTFLRHFTAWKKSHTKLYIPWKNCIFMQLKKIDLHHKMCLILNN